MTNKQWKKLAQVECHSYYKVDQVPYKFRVDNHWIRIDKILSEILVGGIRSTDPIFRVFEVESGKDRFRLRVKQDGISWEYQIIPLTPDNVVQVG